MDPLIEWLSDRGYEVVEDWRPIRVELRSDDRAVDIHPMEVDAAGDGVQRGFGDETFAHCARDRAEGMRFEVVPWSSRLRRGSWS
ncbi:hypothetical protein DAD186_06680 [Dermabacter vaginalis]|uniref:Uncharacterized protein n=1 Tax=Dermabacter vaginalis TaxID=1630135 RepID=A0A1B0ZH08_9MICO|nr:hypothetical protein DAD186_06680 [Dermabacter vaginalis]